MNIVSDNTATAMLVDLVGRENINELMTEIGCPEINVTLNVHEMFLHAWHLPLDRPVSVERLARAAGAKPMDYDSLTFDRSSRSTIATARA
jgi:beta-lactamase class A